MPDEFTPQLFTETEDGGSQFLGGRFDAEGHAPYTQNDIDADPRLAKLANSYAHSEHQNQQLTENKAVVYDALPDEFWSQDFQFTEDDKIQPEARKRMVKAGIPEAGIQLVETLLSEVLGTRRASNEAWKQGVNETIDGKYDEMEAWAKGFYTEEQMTKFNTMLNDKDTRDAMMQKFVSDWKQDTGQTFETKVPAMKTGDTNTPAGGEANTYPGTYDEASAAYNKEYQASDNPDSLDEKWARTLKRFGPRG